MTTQWESYNKSFLTDGIRFICGEELGHGISREVFVYLGNPDFVIKVEVNTTDRFQNVMEFNFWQDACDCSEIMKWIAPCVRISPHGNWLLQARTMPVSLAEIKRRHKRIPIWLTDSKVGNWGKLPNGKIVCHDYGTHLAVPSMRASTKKADWWEQ